MNKQLISLRSCLTFILGLFSLISVEGGELFERIVNEHYQLTELDAIVFMRQICEGVQYLHQQYILHLDLKVKPSALHHTQSHFIHKPSKPTHTPSRTAGTGQWHQCAVKLKKSHLLSASLHRSQIYTSKPSLIYF